MKSPAWFRQQVAVHGGQIIADETTEEFAAATLADDVIEKDPVFGKAIIAEYVRKKLEAWVASHQPRTALPSENGQLDLFPELPRKLEVSPGRFATVSVMTRHDWETALKQARTKADNATGYAERIERAHDQVVPLLTDDSLTTADVWPRQKVIGLFAAGGEER